LTKALPFTEAGLARAIRAAMRAGLEVAGVRSDGTLVLKKPGERNPLQPADAALAERDLKRWDIEG
jgi:hypothetical protein